jgi:hypothetical protein
VADEGTGPEEIAGTRRATRRVALAMWWKLSLLWAAFQLAIGFVTGLLGYVIPFGQLRFWLATLISTLIYGLFGEQVTERIDYVLAGEVTLVVALLAIEAAFFFVLMHWLLSSHIGRTFGHFRLTLQRV